MCIDPRSRERHDVMTRFWLFSLAADRLQSHLPLFFVEPKVRETIKSNDALRFTQSMLLLLLLPSIHITKHRQRLDGSKPDFQTRM